MIMLKVTDLTVNYGGIEALKGISFDVRQGQIVSLIGANGAGKSTTLRAISGLVRPSSGSINFMGRDITSLNSQKIVAEGIALVPEGRRVSPTSRSRRTSRSVLTCARIRMRSKTVSAISTAASPALGNANGSWQVPCPAANSRCWPLVAP